LLSAAFASADMASGGSPLDRASVLVAMLAVLSAAVLGVVFGVLALVYPGHGHSRSNRRFLAWVGIAVSLLPATLAGYAVLA
jgi:hypothetical protein